MVQDALQKQKPRHKAGALAFPRYTSIWSAVDSAEFVAQANTERVDFQVAQGPLGPCRKGKTLRIEPSKSVFDPGCPVSSERVLDASTYCPTSKGLADYLGIEVW